MKETKILLLSILISILVTILIFFTNTQLSYLFDKERQTALFYGFLIIIVLSIVIYSIFEVLKTIFNDKNK